MNTREHSLIEIFYGARKVLVRIRSTVYGSHGSADRLRRRDSHDNIQPYGATLMVSSTQLLGGTFSYDRLLYIIHLVNKRGFNFAGCGLFDPDLGQSNFRVHELNSILKGIRLENARPCTRQKATVDGLYEPAVITIVRCYGPPGKRRTRVSYTVEFESPHKMLSVLRGIQLLIRFGACAWYCFRRSHTMNAILLSDDSSDSNVEEEERGDVGGSSTLSDWG